MSDSDHHKTTITPAQDTAHSSEQPVLCGPRKAGVGLHFSSLASPYGIGDIGDSALVFVDKLVRMKIQVWQFLPTGPTAYGDSPYQPLSAFAGNEMLIGVESLIRRGLVTTDEAESLTTLPTQSVDYAQLIPRKQALLKRAAERFPTVASAELKADYEAFLVLNNNRWLRDYAVYRVLKTKHDERPWPEWGSEFVNRDTQAMRQLQKIFREEIEQVKIIQFLFDRQWQILKRYAQDKNVSLFGDMPIYIALDSSDAWAHPEILMLNQYGQPSCVAGVPPDYFSSDGQLWGNPLYDWKYHESNGYQWWIERMQHAANQLDLVRIDHFRGFESFWAIPADAQTAREGEWLAGPGEKLFSAMRRALGSLPIIAEDLGVITPEVETLLKSQNIPGMKVLQFLVGDPAFDLADITEQTVCYTGTHDNDTTVGWFNGGTGDSRPEQEIAETRLNTLKVTGSTGEDIHLDLIRLAFSCQAKLAVAPMQDFLGLDSDARLNTPGTTSNNWRWRVKEEQLLPETCDFIAKLVEETSRS